MKTGKMLYIIVSIQWAKFIAVGGGRSTDIELGITLEGMSVDILGVNGSNGGRHSHVLYVGRTVIKRTARSGVKCRGTKSGGRECIRRHSRNKLKVDSGRLTIDGWRLRVEGRRLAGKSKAKELKVSEV
jgi:hypothetical protein